jgi:hypothetical protein
MPFVPSVFRENIPTAEFGMISAETVCWKENSQICNEDFYLPLYLPLWVKYWLRMMSTGTDTVKSFAKFFKLYIDKALNFFLLCECHFYRFQHKAFQSEITLLLTFGTSFKAFGTSLKGQYSRFFGFGPKLVDIGQFLSYFRCLAYSL